MTNMGEDVDGFGVVEMRSCFFSFKKPTAKKKPKDFILAPMQGNSLLGRGSP